MTRIIAASLLAWILAVPAVAQTLPQLTEPVNDFAHVIDAESARELDKRIRSLQATTKDVVVVATVDSYAPYASIEEYAVKLFERAGIGQKGQDNGLLIVLAVKERRVRIEVGYGLEGFITDGFSGDTIRQAMLPEFRNGRYGPGLLAGATRLIQRIAEERGVTLQDVPAPAVATPASRGLPVPVIIVIVIIVLIILSNSRRSGPPTFRRGGWGGPGLWMGGLGGFGRGGFGGGFGGGGFGGGGGGGGFGGFGGGGSGGGGASGGW